MLFRFYFMKALREQKKTIAILPIVSVVVLVLVITLILYAPGLLTGATYGMIKDSLDELGNKEGALVVATLLSQAPFFSALFCSAVGSNMSSGIVDVEVRSGAIEVALARGYTFQQVLKTMFLTSLVLGAMTATVLILTMSLLIIGGTYYYEFDLGAIFPTHIFVLSYVCLLSGVTGGFMMQTLLPRMAKIKAGSNASVGQLAAMLPIIFLVVITIGFHEVSIWTKIVWFSVVLIALSILFLAITVRKVSLPQTLER